MRTSQELHDELMDKLKEISNIKSMAQQIKGWLGLKDFIESIQEESYQEGLKEGEKKRYETTPN